MRSRRASPATQETSSRRSSSPETSGRIETRQRPTVLGLDTALRATRPAHSAFCCPDQFRAAKALTAFLAIVLLTLPGCGIIGSRRPEAPQVKIEFRRAEDKPGPGLTEADVAESDRKVYLHDRVELSNADIARARVKKGLVGPVVEVKLTKEGARRFALVTTDHLGKQLAIVVDGQVISAPIIKESISGGKLVVSGSLTQEQAERIAQGIAGK